MMCVTTVSFIFLSLNTMCLSVNSVCKTPAVTQELFFFFLCQNPLKTVWNRPAAPIFIQKSLSLLDQLLSAFECFHGSQVIPRAKYMLVLALADAD